MAIFGSFTACEVNKHCMNKRNFPFLLFLSLLFFACDTEPSQQQSATTDPTDSTHHITDDPEAESSQAEETNAHQEAILQKLNAYYDDLENEQLDESQYFAPVVEVFYTQKNQDREKIGEIIRSGFEGIISRRIELDDRTFQFSQEGDRYILEFEGLAKVRKKGQNESTTEGFHNRFVFNADYQIVEYGPALQAKGEERHAAPHEEAKPAVSRLLLALSQLDFEKADAFIHPDVNLRFITRPGAYDVIYEVKSFREVIEYNPWLKEGFESILCDISIEEMPEFDCETFDKEGCFLYETNEYSRLVDNMQALSEAEIASFTQGQMNAAVKVQQAVQLQFASTEQAIAMLLGNIEGRWYVLIVDKAMYDCSA